VCSRVKADSLTFVAGMVPAPGETVEAWSAAVDPPDMPEDPIEAFLQDLPPEQAAAALAAARPQVAKAMGEPLPIDAWPDVPTRYLLCRDDNCFPADWARAMARERLGIEADEIDGGHCPFLSRPEELAARLEALDA